MVKGASSDETGADGLAAGFVPAARSALQAASATRHNKAAQTLKSLPKISIAPPLQVSCRQAAGQPPARAASGSTTLQSQAALGV
jgi:hypothetical protein